MPVKLQYPVAVWNKCKSTESLREVGMEKREGWGRGVAVGLERLLIYPTVQLPENQTEPWRRQKEQRGRRKHRTRPESYGRQRTDNFVAGKAQIKDVS